MATYSGYIQPNLLRVSAKRDMISNEGYINNCLIPKKGIVTRVRKGINTKDFHIVPFKRIPRERVLNKYADKNIKL